MQATRFQVSGRKAGDSSDDEEGDEAQDLLDGQMESNQDTKMYKSFRHFTREALPRLDNYRNMLSIQAQNRPTLDELHNATLSQKVSTCTFVLQLCLKRRFKSNDTVDTCHAHSEYDRYYYYYVGQTSDRIN